MNKLLVVVLTGITMISCSKEEQGYYFTTKGTVTVVDSSESESRPLAGVEVFISETKCKGDCFLCAPVCKFIQNLETKDISDGDGNYSITHFREDGLSYSAEIVVPEGFTLIKSGGIKEVTENSTFEYNFVLMRTN